MRIAGISTDPFGVYIAHTTNLDLYWWSAKHEAWVRLIPEDYGVAVN